MTGEIENVTHGRRAKRIDGLRIIADHRKPLAVWLESQKDGRLKPIGVLIFIHQDMIEPLSNIGGDGWLHHHLRPIE